MSVYKPAKSRFYHYDFQWKGGRHHGSTGCASKRDAERFEAAERRRVTLGEDVKPTITVDEAFGLYWDAKGQFQRNKVTTDYQQKAIIVGLGQNVPVADVTLTMFDRYVAKRRNGRANASVNREIELARRVWRFAKGRGYDVPDLAWGELLLSEPKERIRELSEAEEARLMAELPADLLAMVRFALMSGQRKSEIVALRWSDVDLPAQRATFTLKGGKKHTIPLTDAMVALIANQPKACPQVFTYECERHAPRRDGRAPRIKGGRYPFSRYGWTRKWQAALERAGIDDFRFHDLRHTKGTRSIRATGNLKAVQKLFGHTEIATTARYAHAIEDDVRAVMSASESRIIPEAAASEVVKPLIGKQNK